MGDKSGSAQKTYDYFGSLIAAICQGPVEAIEALIVDGKTIVGDESGPIVRGTGDDYEVLEPDAGCEKYLHDDQGKIVMFWGTATQDLSAVFNEAWSGANPWSNHPDYRGVCLLALRGFLFGRERTTAPNIEVVVRRTPVADTSLVAAEDNVLDADGQCNPVAAIVELLTGANGLQLPVAALNASEWLAASAYCADDTDRYFCSPLLTSQADARSVLPALLAMFDGALYWTAAGKLGIKLLQPGVDPGGLATLDANHLTERPRIECAGWPEVPTTALIRYRDMDASYKEREAKADNLLAIRARSLSKAITVDCPHVTRATQAATLAAETIRRLSRPAGAIEVRVRRAHAAGLLPGSKVKADTDPEPGGTGTAQLCVVQDRREDATGPVELTLKPDTLVSSVVYSPDIAPHTPTEPSCSAIDADDCLVIPLPTSIWEPASVAIIAPRPANDVVGFNTQFAVDTDDDGDTDDEDFADLGSQPGFAVRMTLDEDLTDDETVITLTLEGGATAPDAKLASLVPDNAVDAAQDLLWLVLANVDEDGRVVVTDGVAELEICSVVSRAAVDSDTHDYTVLRARKGTSARGWTASETPRCYIVPAVNINPMTHPDMVGTLSSGLACFFRLTAYTAVAMDESTPIPEVSIVLPGAMNRAPVVTWTTPSGSSGSTTNGSYPPEFDVTDADGDLIHISITSRKTDGSGFVEHLSQTIDPVGAYSFNSALTFAVGTHVLTVTATDLAGHTTSSTRTIVSTSGSPSGPQPPEFDPEGGGAYMMPLQVTITSAAPADSIQYKVLSIGAAQPTSWDTESSLSKEITLTSKKRIWARSVDSDAGPAYSDATFADYLQEF